MTDCFIMIHVIIFFVGVTDMLSGNRGAWFGRRQHRGCRCWYPKKCSAERGNLCSWVFVGLGCVHGITVYNSRWFGGILLSVWSGAAPEARLNQTPLQNCHSSDSKNSLEIGQ